MSNGCHPAHLFQHLWYENKVVVKRRNRLTELQNHRMVGVGRDLCGSPSPTPCPSRVTQNRLHRTTSRRGWNISREGDSTTSLGSLFRFAALISLLSPSEFRFL